MSSDSDCSLQEIQASLTKLTQQFLEMTQRLNEMNTTMKTLMGQLKTFTELTDGSNASDESEDDSGMGTTEFMTLLLSCI